MGEKIHAFPWVPSDCRKFFRGKVSPTFLQDIVRRTENTYSCIGGTLDTCLSRGGLHFNPPVFPWDPMGTGKKCRLLAFREKFHAVLPRDPSHVGFVSSRVLAGESLTFLQDTPWEHKTFSSGIRDGLPGGSRGISGASRDLEGSHLFSCILIRLVATPMGPRETFRGEPQGISSYRIPWDLAGSRLTHLECPPRPLPSSWSIR